MLSAVFFVFVAAVMLMVVSILVLSEHVSKKTVDEIQTLVLREQVHVWDDWVLESVVNDPPDFGSPIWKLAGIQHWGYEPASDDDYVTSWPGPMWMPEPGETPRRSMAPAVLDSWEKDLIIDEFLSQQEVKDNRERQRPHRRCTLCGSRCDGRAQKRYGLSPWEKAAAAQKATPEMVYRDSGHQEAIQGLADSFCDNPWDHFHGDPMDLDAIWAFKETLDRNSSGRV